MNLQATFTNPLGQAKTLEIKDGLNLQDAYNVVANDDFAPTQITLEATNMNSSDSNVEPDKQVETAYDLIGRHSSNDIIDKHKISSDELAVLLEEGTNHELEHTSSYLIAMKIAQDHLYEDLMYYSKLKEAMLARGAVLSMKKPTEKKRDEKGGLIAPNGKTSNLTPQQYELVRTPEFKAWFGDWENDPANSSKVIDENGEPLVVYRGDNADNKKGFVFKKGFNRMGFINKYRLPNQYFYYFVNNYDVALGYGKNQIEYHNDKVEETGKGKMWEAKVTPYFLNIRNPIDITPANPLFPTFNEFEDELKNQMGQQWFQHWQYQNAYDYGTRISNSYLNKIFENKLGKDYLDDKYISKWQKEGFVNDKTNKDSYQFFIEFKNMNAHSDILNKVVRGMLEKNVDGLVFLELTHWDDGFWANNKKYESGELKYNYKKWVEKPKVYAALESNQIKLADGTNTTFDGNKPDIRFDKGGYVSEDILIDNNIDKIDDIYVLTEDDKPIKSLGQFTFKGFGKYVMQDLAAELYDDYKIRLRNDFAIMLGEDVIKPSIKVAQMKGDKIELLAIIYNALVTDEKPLAYVYNEDGEMVGKFTDEDEAEEMVNDNDGYYSEVRVEEVTTTETILAMEFDFQKHEMTFVSSLLDKKNTHKFKYGGKL
jgi:hypothetical protein